MYGFRQSHAVVLGIDNYDNGIPSLRTAVNDARSIAHVLKVDYGYDLRLLDENVTLERLRTLFVEDLPRDVEADDRLLIYFAGHGVALDGDDGPAGYLVPQDARREDRSSFLPMTELSGWLERLPCRHLLLILDCCFAGAFRWSSTRDLGALPEVIHRERFERFIRDAAWQVLTSAAYDQEALDVLSGEVIGLRARAPDREGHSPFAVALLQALRGEADLIPRPRNGRPGGDGVITATELYLYLRECVEVGVEGQGRRQTPGLWPLKRHDKGEYIHLVPGHELNLPPAPELNETSNPYRGLQSYDEQHAPLFFGRSNVVAALAGRVRSQPLTIVLGASGTGKSSVVRAGLLRYLRCQEPEVWQILPPLRPGNSPLAALAALTFPGESADSESAVARLTNSASDPEALARRVADWAAASVGTSLSTRLLIVVDQFEELLTICWDVAERECFLVLLGRALAACPDRLRIVVTLRSDFEPQFAGWRQQEEWLAGRVTVPAMTLDEYREAIEGPASVRVMYFRGTKSSQAFIGRLIGDVANTPGGLPLLSFTLSELYLRYLRRGGDDRSLCEQDYEVLGGVGGSLRNRADEVYRGLPDEAHRQTMRRAMLRMVSVEGGELARRRVPDAEFDYGSDAENDRVREVLLRLTAARLVVRGEDVDGSAFVEPAHDELIRGWPLLLRWSGEDAETLQLRRRLGPAASAWGRGQGAPWSFGEPRLAVLYRISTSSDNWLNRTETRFVRFSRRLRLAVIGGATVTTLLVLVIVAALEWRAYASRQEADSRRVAALRSIHDVSETAIATFLAMDKEGILNAAPARGLRKRVLSDATARMGLIARDLSSDPKTLRFLAEEYVNLADQVQKSGEPGDALTSYRLALTSLEELGRNSPRSLTDQIRIAFVHNNMGSVLAGLGQAAEAVTERITAKAICEPLSSRFPDDVESQRLLSAICGNLAMDLSALGRSAEALDLTRKAIDIESRLARKTDHPKYLWFLLNLSNSWSNFSNILEERGSEQVAALEAGRRAVKLQEDAVASFVASPEIPARFEFVSALGRRHWALASTLARAREFDEALRHNRLAEQALLEAQQQFGPDTSVTTPNHLMLGDLASLRIQRGDLLDRRDDSAGALRAFKQAEEVATRLAPLYGIYPRYGLILIEALTRHAALLARTGDRGGASAAEATAWDAASQLFDALLADGEYTKAADLAENVGHLAGSSNPASIARWLARCAEVAAGDSSIGEQERAARATAYLGRAKAALQAVIDQPSSRAAETVNRVAWFLITTEKEVLRDAARARTLIESALRREPENGDYWNTLALAHIRLGEWDRAVAAELKAMPRRHGGNGYDLYVLSLAKARLGVTAEASTLFARAEGWREEHQVQFGPDLDALREEARQALNPATPSAATR